MGKFDDIPVFSKFADLPEPYVGKFADIEAPVVVAVTTFALNTVAWLINKLIEERAMPGARPLGSSQLSILRLLQRLPIGAKLFATLRPIDFVEHCRARKALGLSFKAKSVKPQTINQDMTYLSGVLKYAFEIWEFPGAEEACKAYKKARPQLMREQLISKSEPRDRLPTPDELARLRALFVEQNKRKFNKIDMVLVMDAELVTGRRISELCRIERQHVNVEHRTCMLYDLKNSKGKGFNGEFALIEGAWELFERRLKEIHDDPRTLLLPFRARSCSARYTAAKNELGIKGLRMHDNRANCFVRLLDLGYSETQVQKGISLHKGDGKVLRESYLRIKAKDLHKGPAAQRAMVLPN